MKRIREMCFMQIHRRVGGADHIFVIVTSKIFPQKQKGIFQKTPDGNSLYPRICATAWYQCCLYK